MTQLMQNMTEPELREHLNRMGRANDSIKAPDCLGFMLILAGDDKIAQFISSLDRSCTPSMLREVADRIERNHAVTR